MTQIRRAYSDGPYGQIHYATAGDGEVVLLLHQTPRSWDEYAEVMARLAPRWRAVAMDLPGMGASDAPPGEPTIEAYADAAIALLNSLEVEAAHVVGHHTGSFVATDLAARHGARVRSLTLSAPSWVDDRYREMNPDGGDLEVDNAPPVASGQHVLELWRQRQPAYPEGATALLQTYLRDALRVVDPRAGHVACGRYPIDRAISLVGCPVLLLGHDADPYTIDDLEQFTSRMPTAQVEIVNGGVVPLEWSSAAVAKAVTHFLERVEEPSSAADPYLACTGVDVVRRLPRKWRPGTPSLSAGHRIGKELARPVGRAPRLRELRVQ